MDLLGLQMEWLSSQTDAQIVVVGYPDIALPRCLGLDEDEQRRMTALINRHDRLMADQTQELNDLVGIDRFHWVPVHEAFDGKGACALSAQNRVIHGLGRITTDVREVYHPTFEGAQLYAQTLVDQGIDGLRRVSTPTQARATCLLYTSDAADE